MKVYLQRKMIEPSYTPCKGCYFADKDCESKDAFKCIDTYNDYIFVQIKKRKKLSEY